MTVPGKHACRHGFVASEATLRTAPFPALLMALFATLRKRRVQHVADHAFPLAAMGIMTGKTALQALGVIQMALLQVLGLMTGKTHLIRFVLQQLAIYRLMGTMAGVTLTLSKRAVRVLEFLRHFFMTGETGGAQLILEQSIAIAGMGLMADKTISTAHRLMNHALLERFLLGCVTGIAQLSALLFQQTLEMSHMGIVAWTALALCQRLMHNFTAECLFLMAVKADIICCCRCSERQNSGKPENDDNPIIKKHYFLSSPG